MDRRRLGILGAVAILGGLLGAGSDSLTQLLSPEDLITDPARLMHTEPSTPLLLLVLRSDCRLCSYVQPQWEQLIAGSSEAVAVRVIVSQADMGPGPRFESHRPEIHYATSSALHEAGIEFVPTTIFLDGHGSIRFKKVGLLTAEELDILRNLLDTVTQ